MHARPTAEPGNCENWRECVISTLRFMDSYRPTASCTVLSSRPFMPGRTIGGMANVTLYEFIGNNRDELIGRCRAKVATRSSPPSTEAEISRGVPLFLDQLCEELRHGPSNTHEISKSATAHGHDLLLQGFTVSQVVHDYGDICQSVTDLAVELKAPISTDDFRTLNRTLDDAIASAVTEYAHGQDVTRDGESHQLRNLTDSAITAFEVLRTGNVGVGGSTGAVVLRSLMGIRAALVDRKPDTAAKPAAVAKPAAATK
jgi:hypothetical protein